MAEEYPRLILTDDNGAEHPFLPLLTFALQEREYIVLQPEKENGREELAIFRFHPDEEDRMVLDDIGDDAEYYEAARQAEALLNGDVETQEYLLDDGSFPEEEMAELREAGEEDDDFCYEDENGRLFIFDEDGKPVYLDETEDDGGNG